MPIVVSKAKYTPKEYAMAHPSVAHTFGNVASIITEYIKGLFLPDYFKTVHIQSTVAYKQLAIQRARNREMFKKSKPMLIIRPRIDIDDTDVFLYGTFLTERMTDLYYSRDFSNLQPFLYDEVNGIELKYLLNRLKMLFDVTIVTETQMEQINATMYLKNMVRQNHPFNLDVALESFIPLELLNVIAKEYNMPIKDEKGSVKKFMDKLNSISYYPITYKLKKSSGNDEFFRYYPAKIDTMFTGIGLNDGEKKGFIYDAFETSFTVSTEFFATGLYYYFTYNKKFLDEIRMDLITNNPKDRIIPIFTVSNLFDISGLPEGWTFYSTNMFEVDKDAIDQDILPLNTILNDSIMATVKYHNDKGMNKRLFIFPVVMMDNTKLKEGEDYIFDLDNMQLIIKRLNFKATYRLTIYCNNRYINELIKKEYNLE